MARQNKQRGRQTLSGQKLWTLTWAVRNVLTRGFSWSTLTWSVKVTVFHCSSPLR